MELHNGVGHLALPPCVAHEEDPERPALPRRLNTGTHTRARIHDGPAAAEIVVHRFMKSAATGRIAARGGQGCRAPDRGPDTPETGPESTLAASHPVLRVARGAGGAFGPQGPSVSLAIPESC